jgi:biopolymer transport protein ExbD
MSHGPADKCEPNLVPLLDMVLQLVMFFMVCANFVMEQVNESIKLPSAVAARPLDPNAQNIIFLNVNEEGFVLLSGLDAQGKNKDDNVLRNPIQVKNYMTRRFDEDVRAAGGDKTKPPRSTLIIRADKKTPFDKTYGILKACRMAGYQNCQLRAIRDGGALGEN